MPEVLMATAKMDVADFVAGTKEAGAAHDQFVQKIVSGGQQAHHASEQSAHSMKQGYFESMEAISLMSSEVFGVRIPRVLARMLAHTQMVSAMMAVAFTPIMVIGMLSFLGKIPEALEKGVDKLRGWGDLQKETFKEHTADIQRAIEEWEKYQSVLAKGAMAGLTGSAETIADMKRIEAEMVKLKLLMLALGEVKTAAEAHDALIAIFGPDVAGHIEIMGHQVDAARTKLEATKDTAKWAVHFFESMGEAAVAATGPVGLLFGSAGAASKDFMKSAHGLADALSPGPGAVANAQKVYDDALAAQKRYQDEAFAKEMELSADRAKLPGERAAELEKDRGVTRKHAEDHITQERDLGLKMVSLAEETANTLHIAGQRTDEENLNDLLLLNEARLVIQKTYNAQFNANARAAAEEAAAVAKAHGHVSPGAEKPTGLKSDVEDDAEAQRKRLELRSKFDVETRKLDDDAAKEAVSGAEKVANARAAALEANASRQASLHTITYAAEADMQADAETLKYNAHVAALQTDLMIEESYGPKRVTQAKAIQDELRAALIEHNSKISGYYNAAGDKQLADDHAAWEAMKAERVNAADSEMADARESSASLEAEHLISAQARVKLELAAMAEWKAKRDALADEEIAYNLAKYGEDNVHYKDAVDKKIAMDRKYGLDVKKVNDEAAKAAQKPWDDYVHSVESGLNRMMNSMITGHQRTRVAIQQFWQGMVTDSALAIEKMMEKELAMELKKVAMHIWAAQAKTAATATGIMAEEGILYTAGLKQVARDAYVSAANTWDAVTASGVGGPLNPVIAGVEAAGVFAAVMALAAFETGGIVPKTGPILAHSQEAVLPANLTAMLMHAADTGEGGGGGDTHQHLHYYAAQGENPGSINRNLDALKRAKKDGKLKFLFAH